MKQLIIFLIAVGALATVSCEQSVHTAKIKRIDTLLNILDTSLAKISSWEAEDIQRAKKEAEADLHFIQRSYPDSMDLSLATRLGDYKINRKLLKTILENGDGLKNEMEYSVRQLKNLRHDLNNNRIDSTQASKYMKDEWKAASLLMQRYNMVSSKQERALTRHAELKTVADSVIQELNRWGIR